MPSLMGELPDVDVRRIVDRLREFYTPGTDGGIELDSLSCLEVMLVIEEELGTLPDDVEPLDVSTMDGAMQYILACTQTQPRRGEHVD